MYIYGGEGILSLLRAGIAFVRGDKGEGKLERREKRERGRV